MQQGDKQSKRGGLGAQKAPDNESLKLKRKTDYAEQLRARHKETIRVRERDPGTVSSFPSEFRIISVQVSVGPHFQSPCQSISLNIRGVPYYKTESL